MFNMLTYENPVPDNVFTASTKLMGLLPLLDKFRATEDLFNLNKRTVKIKRTFTNLKEKVDFLRHHMKGIAEKCGPFSMAHQCFRKLLILSSQRKDYNIIKEYSKVIIEDISSLVHVELSTDINFLYLLKLKVENLQYILNLISSIQSSDFPI